MPYLLRISSHYRLIPVPLCRLHPQPVWFRVGDLTSGEFSAVSTGPVQAGPKRGGGRASLALFGDMGTYEYAPTAPLGAVDAQVNT